MAMDWMNLKRKRYDANGNEIDENGNIVNPEYANPAPVNNDLSSQAGNFIAAATPAAKTGGALSGLGSGAGTGAALGGTLGTAVPGIGNVVGTAAGAVIGAIGGAVNGADADSKTQAAEKQGRLDEQTQQQRMNILMNQKNYRDDQAQGLKGMDWLSTQADLAHKNRTDYRTTLARALGY